VINYSLSLPKSLFSVDETVERVYKCMDDIGVARGPVETEETDEAWVVRMAV